MIESTMATDPTTGGKKGLSADRYDLIPPKALEYLALIYGQSCVEHGGKYEARNWERGYAWSRSLRALMKHAWAVVRGGWLDPDSGLPHIMHAAWHCFTLCTYYDYKLGTDDRSLLVEHTGRTLLPRAPYLVHMRGGVVELPHPDDVIEHMEQYREQQRSGA